MSSLIAGNEYDIFIRYRRKKEGENENVGGGEIKSLLLLISKFYDD